MKRLHLTTVAPCNRSWKIQCLMCIRGIIIWIICIACMLDRLAKSLLVVTAEVMGVDLMCWTIDTVQTYSSMHTVLFISLCWGRQSLTHLGSDSKIQKSNLNPFTWAYFWRPSVTKYQDLRTEGFIIIRLLRVHSRNQNLIF